MKALKKESNRLSLAGAIRSTDASGIVNCKFLKMHEGKCLCLGMSRMKFGDEGNNVEVEFEEIDRVTRGDEGKNSQTHWPGLRARNRIISGRLVGGCPSSVAPQNHSRTFSRTLPEPSPDSPEPSPQPLQNPPPSSSSWSEPGYVYHLFGTAYVRDPKRGQRQKQEMSVETTTNKKQCSD